jgi:hypothetical protein
MRFWITHSMGATTGSTDTGTSSSGRARKPKLWHKKTICHIIIVILLISTTIHSNWTLFHQQMSSIMNSNGDNNKNKKKNQGNPMALEKERRYGISWEWKRYGSTGSTSITAATSTSVTPTGTSGRAQYKILIAQYDAGGSDSNYHTNSYSTLLNITSRINQLYAKQYHYDYVLLRGIVFRTFYESYAQIPTSRATYNKVYILQKAIEWDYDFLLLLDSDAMVYDFNRDIAQSLLPQHKMIVAHQVGDHINNNQQQEFYNINIGVTLWNIRHTMVRTILRRWKILCYIRIIFRLDDNDQNPLQNVLHYFVTFGRSLSSTNQYLQAHIIEENHHDFAYRGGTFIKHFIRYNSKTWIQDNDQQQRMEEIANVAHEICVRHEPMCNQSDVP